MVIVNNLESKVREIVDRNKCPPGWEREKLEMKEDGYKRYFSILKRRKSHWKKVSLEVLSQLYKTSRERERDVGLIFNYDNSPSTTYPNPSRTHQVH